MAKYQYAVGHAKMGGRKKGTRNKLTQARAELQVDAVLSKKGVKPIEEILKLMPLLEAKDQVRAYLELQSYIQGKPRVVDVNPEAPTQDGEMDPATVSTDKLLQIVRGSNQE